MPCFGPASRRATVVSGAHMSATEIRIHDDDFFVNGLPVCPGAVWEGHRAEGLLLNSRMVQATFDDLNPATRHLWGRTGGRLGPGPQHRRVRSGHGRLACRRSQLHYGQPAGREPLRIFQGPAMAQLRLWGGRQSRPALHAASGSGIGRSRHLGHGGDRWAVLLWSIATMPVGRRGAHGGGGSNRVAG